MDPLSMLILLGIVTVTASRTVGSAVTDSIAQAKGQTPPSLEKWRSNQKTKEARGEKRATTEPSPWRRRWNNSIEYRNAKAAQNHQADMEHLRDHGRENVAKRKQKLERRTQRRDAINTRLAGWGASSWEAAKQAAEKAKNAHHERKTEKQAWTENDRRDAVGTEVVDQPEPSREDSEHSRTQDGADVLTFTRRPGSGGADELEVSSSGGSNVRGDPNDPSTWHGTDSHGRDIQTGRGPSRDVTEPGGPVSVVHDDDTYLLGKDLSPERRVVLDHQRQQGQATDPSHTPDEEADHASANPATEPGSTETHIRNTEGGTTVSAPDHSGEITDLPSALDYVTSASQYCQQVSGTFETSLAQANATAQELQGQLGRLETAQSSLHGAGLDSEAARLGSVSEHFSSLAEAMQQVETLLSSTQDALGAAQSELDASAHEFQSQIGISEEIQSHDSVANDTSFYANA